MDRWYYVTQDMKDRVHKLSGYHCAYCGRYIPWSWRCFPRQVILEADHVIPACYTVDTDINNLVSACSDCNQLKKDVVLTDRVRAILKANALWLDDHEEHFTKFGKPVIIRPAGLKSGYSLINFRRYRYMR